MAESVMSKSLMGKSLMSKSLMTESLLMGGLLTGSLVASSRMGENCMAAFEMTDLIRALSLSQYFFSLIRKSVVKLHWFGVGSV